MLRVGSNGLGTRMRMALRSKGTRLFKDDYTSVELCETDLTELPTAAPPMSTSGLTGFGKVTFIGKLMSTEKSLGGGKELPPQPRGKPPRGPSSTKDPCCSHVGVYIEKGALGDWHAPCQATPSNVSGTIAGATQFTDPD